MPIQFSGSNKTTLGLELELQIIDPASGNLVSKAPQIIQDIDDPAFKPELFECIVELNSAVCHTIAELRRDIRQKLQRLQSVALEHHCDLLLAGTHPTARWQDQKITQNPRYQALLDRIRWPVRQFLIFGLHLHVGISDAEKAIFVLNRLSNHIPELIALSASSPFYQGLDTGLASSRIKIFEGLPNNGIPHFFRNWNAYSQYVDNFQRYGSIDSFRDIWWDIRPHPVYGTVEIRVCDLPPTLREIFALSAYIYCLTRKIDIEYEERQKFPVIPRWILEENKWRAARYGLQANLINASESSVTPVKKIIRDQLQQISELATQLECPEELAEIRQILAVGSSTERQRIWKYREGNNFSEIIKRLSQEFHSDKFLASAAERDWKSVISS